MDNRLKQQIMAIADGLHQAALFFFLNFFFFNPLLLFPMLDLSLTTSPVNLVQ